MTSVPAKTLIAAAFLLTASWGSARALDGALHCVIDACQPLENCQVFDFGGNRFDPSPGKDYLFGLAEKWVVTPDGYKLDGIRYSGESVMERTTVTMSVTTATKQLQLQIHRTAAGAKAADVTASGSCEFVKTVPLLF